MAMDARSSLPHWKVGVKTPPVSAPEIPHFSFNEVSQLLYSQRKLVAHGHLEKGTSESQNVCTFISGGPSVTGDPTSGAGDAKGAQRPESVPKGVFMLSEGLVAIKEFQRGGGVGNDVENAPTFPNQFDKPRQRRSLSGAKRDCVKFGIVRR